MTSAFRERGLARQLALILRLAGVRPTRWIPGIVAMSLALALLDTVGVLALVPLTQLIGGASTETGTLRVIADIVGSHAPHVLVPVVALAVGLLFVVKSAISIAFRWWLLGRTTRISALASAELVRRYILAPYADHRQRQTSDIYRTVTASVDQASSVLFAVTGLFSDALTLVALTAVLAATSLPVTLLAAGIFGILVLGVQRVLRGRQTRIGEDIAESSLETWQYLLPAMDGFRETRLTSTGTAFADGYRLARLRQAEAMRRMGVLSYIPRSTLELGFVLAIAGIALLMTTSSTPAQTLTVLGVFAAAALRALPSMTSVAAALATMRTGRIGLDVIEATVDRLDRGGTHDETRRSTQPYSGDIAFRNASFRFPDSDRPVLDGITLTVEENRTTAFVGSSGAGKSTLLDLVLGLLEPTSGSLFCGDRDIHDDLSSWHAQLGVVPQEVFLLNDSVAANVAFGVPADLIDLARVEEVLQLTRLTEVVHDLPDRLDTKLGERGVRLSGGQRQRLGLARALYRRPSVLVLDEATSALDNATEHEITRTLAELSGTLTILVVAHRLSTVRDADKLAFLKDGRVEAQGTFEELRQNHPDFARLVELGDLS
ncbi:ABC transporter ATP-binding protein/permease [Microbacterium marinum]|uniref:ABC transporter ATP-binding protein n=1 Tax=Microbacterium marinum TaxID=421115 RepID=UPI00384BBA8A